MPQKYYFCRKIHRMYIHQYTEWPVFSWDKLQIANKLARVNKAAGFLAGKLNALGFDNLQSAVVETVSNDIISSSAIEGVMLNSEQVRSSVARKLGVSIPNEVDASHYIEGIVEMMLDATVNFRQPLTDDRLFGWHCCLFPNGRSGYSPIDVGKYRSGEMRVVSGAFMHEKIHYIAPSPDKVEAEMKAFLEWFNDGTTSNDYLKSAIAHFWFVAIHPFDDGNGRIGRAIADMALSQADDSQMRFFSMSRQINKNKRSYYDILERTQTSDCEITEWLNWYLDCMIDAISDADNMLSQVLDKAAFWQAYGQFGLTERQKQIINIYLDGYEEKLTIKNWAKHGKISTDTAARDIKELVEKGILEPQPGKVRDVNYGICCNGKVIVCGPKDDW